MVKVSSENASKSSNLRSSRNIALERKEASKLRQDRICSEQKTMKRSGYSRVLFGIALTMTALLEVGTRGHSYGNNGRGKRPGKVSKVALEATEAYCPRICGKVDIPYPFGLSRECAKGPYFVLECKHDLGANLSGEGDGPWPVLTYARGTYTVDRYNTTDGSNKKKLYEVDFFQVERIDPGSMIINVTAIKAMGCNDVGDASISLDLSSPYLIGAENLFFVVGCSSHGSISSSGPTGFSQSCGELSCVNQFMMEYCGPYDCCVQPIPGSKNINLKGGGIAYNGLENCGFCSVIFPSSFRNPALNEFDTGIGGGIYGLKLLWSIQEENLSDCSAAQADTDRYECSQDAECKNHGQAEQSDHGYYCQCNRTGYEGDGYKNGTGCKDINECDIDGVHNCSHLARCNNAVGSYECICPKGMKGNGLNQTLDSTGTDCTWINKCLNETLSDCSKDAKCTFHEETGDYDCSCQGDTVGDGHDGEGGTGCKQKSNLRVIIGASVTGVMAFIVINVFLLWYIHRRRQNAFIHSFFSHKELLDELENIEGAKYCKIFTFSDLQDATKNFSVELGKGAFGTVYEGTLRDDTKVAIKKAKYGIGETRNEAKQFVNEIVILSQVSHRNLVRLLGCCLETPVPVLVYEFIPNGNLQQHINPRGLTDIEDKTDSKIFSNPPLNWNRRLKIAVETAEALTYLHWGTSPAIYHRDVKCANILLDYTYNVKVADFGLSKLVPLESMNVVPTALQGTPGYMDPEFFDRYQLTDKSDVYSYGVVLLVLLTAQKPVDLARQPREQNLVIRCNRLMDQGLFIDIIDPELTESLEDSNTLEAIDAVAKVALKCVSRHAEDRPTMKEVLMELQNIREKSRKRNAPNLKTRKVNFYGDYSLIPHADGQSSNWNSPKSLDLSTWSQAEASKLYRTTSVEFEDEQSTLSPR